MNKLDNADRYIAENKGKVTSRPAYHFTPPIGWMNDPNGFCCYNNEYHLFYQYYPYGVSWAEMHWGHAVSADMLSWKHMPVAMAADSDYDRNGCFSGSAIEKGGDLYLLYTGHLDENYAGESVPQKIVQQQCLGVYRNGGRVEKVSGNPVISKDELPDGYQVRDFRDPKVYYRNGLFYVVLAARNEEDSGSILLYSSADLLSWKFVGDIYRRPAEENILIECPDLFSLDGRDILILSIMPSEPEYKDIIGNRVEYIIGDMDYNQGEFIEESRGLLDLGGSFYAPQSTEDKDGNRVLIGWANDWSVENTPFVEEYGYNGIMTLPRKISFKDGRVQQSPVSLIKDYKQLVESIDNLKLTDRFCFAREFAAQYIGISVGEFDSVLSLQVLASFENSFVFILDATENIISVRSDYHNKIDKQIKFSFAGSLELEVYLDNHLLELYVNGVPLTFSCYDSGKGRSVTLYSQDEVTIDSLCQYEINGVNIE